MEDIIAHLYSDRNLTKLSEKFSSLVDDFGNTSEAIEYCKIWLKKKMESVLKASRNNLRGDKKEVIKKLNTDCLRTAVEEYRKKSREPQNIRPQEHQKNMQKQKQKSKSDGFGTVADAGGYASFAPLEKSGGFIRADGSVGDQMFFGNINDFVSILYTEFCQYTSL